MANCINYNCDDLQPHTINPDCGELLLGGLSDAVIFDCDHQVTDFTNGTQVLAEIAASRAWLVQNIKVGIPLPSEVEMDALKACGTQTLVTYNRTATWVDGNVNNFNTVDFYAPLLGGRTVGAIIFKECGNTDSKVTYIDAEISFRGGKIIPDNNNDLQRYELTLKWKSKYDPESINEPVGVFS